MNEVSFHVMGVSSEADLRPSQTPMMKLFYENS